MAQHLKFLLLALVALHLQAFVATAAPLLPELSARQVVWVTSTSITSVEATVTDVVTAFSPSHGRSSASATSSPLEPTVTRWDTTTVTASPSGTFDPATTAAPADSQRWTLPETFEDLSPLGINKLADGSTNIAVVTGIPASASATSPPPTAASVDQSSPIVTPLPRPWTNSSSAYRIFYPAGSINPSSRPQGGSEFYATPGNLPFKTANNVTLEYSIFFPADFEWVQGGKLPGLYGGHEGCSGGNSAKSCFSTRLMWRKDGAGELYLYAPKDKQTSELCNAPPQSVCDAAYGLSVGRGSFHFAAGGWTHVSQTVRLNTPGQQDGGFELLVNGQHIMRRDDVFYRDVPQSTSGAQGDQEDDGDRSPGGMWRRESQETMSMAYDVLPSLLPVLSQVGHILGDEIPGQEDPRFDPASVPMGTLSVQNPADALKPGQGKKAVTLTVTASTQPRMPPFLAAAQLASQSGDDGAVGFSGLFFSTFFGGHEQSWASPTDQYTWFKDFGMSINA